MRTTYNVRTGVSQIKSTGKKLSNRFAVGVVTAFSVLGGALIPAAAAAPSSCGAAHGAFANVNGNFGDLGQLGGTPGAHNGAVGQDPGATGSNNSSSTCNE